MYEYSFKVEKVVDGDTIDGTVDLGFGVYHSRSLRLLGINTPELHDKDAAVRARAVAARAYLLDRLTKAGMTCVIRTQKDKTEKYGRMLATVLVDGVSLNDEMIAKGHAVAFMV